MSILVNNNTKVICQGITGNNGTFHTEQAMAYGMPMVAGVNAATKGMGVKMLLLTASLSLATVLITGGKASAMKPESFARLALEVCFEGRPDAAGIKQRLVGLNWRESTTARQKAMFLTGMSSAEGKQVALFRTNQVSGREFVSCAIDMSGPAPVEVAAEVARALRITMKVDERDKSNPMYFFFGDFVPQDHLYHLLSIAVAKSNSPTQLGLPKGSQTTTVRISYPVSPLMN